MSITNNKHHFIQICINENHKSMKDGPVRRSVSRNLAELCARNLVANPIKWKQESKRFRAAIVSRHVYGGQNKRPLGEHSSRRPGPETPVRQCSGYMGYTPLGQQGCLNVLGYSSYLKLRTALTACDGTPKIIAGMILKKHV